MFKDPIVSFCVVDSNGILISCDTHMKQCLGYDPADITGIYFRDLLHYSYKDLYLGSPSSYISLNNYHVVDMLNASQQVELCRIIFSEMPSGLNQQQNYIVSIERQTDDVMSCFVRNDGHVTFVNQQVESELGYPSQSCLGKHMKTLIPGMDDNVYLEMCQGYQTNVLARNKEGNAIPVCMLVKKYKENDYCIEMRKMSPEFVESIIHIDCSGNILQCSESFTHCLLGFFTQELIGMSFQSLLVEASDLVDEFISNSSNPSHDSKRVKQNKFSERVKLKHRLGTTSEFNLMLIPSCQSDRAMIILNKNFQIPKKNYAWVEATGCLLGEKVYKQAGVMLYNAKLDNKDVSISVQMQQSLSEHGFADWNEERLRVSQSLQHPSVLSTVLIHRDPTIVCQVQPKGQFLEDIMASQKSLPEEVCRSHFAQLINGLVYLKSQNIHMNGLCAISNIIIEDNHCKWRFVHGDKAIVDLLKPCWDGKNQKTVNPFPLPFGTSSLALPPEVLISQQYDVWAADVWSMAILLFVMSTGDSPFKSFSEIMSARVKFPKSMKSRIELLSFLYFMFKQNPAVRPGLQDVLTHIWINPE